MNANAPAPLPAPARRPHAALFALTLALATACVMSNAASGTAAAAPAGLQLELIKTRRIWDGGSHNAFTDLIQWHGRWWCSFRESTAHVGGNGCVRVLVSRDGEKWKTIKLLSVAGVDMRDPKFSITPDDRLMINCAGSYYDEKTLTGRVSLALFSSDGVTWTHPRTVAGDKEWLWRVTWHDGVAYGAAYNNFLKKNGRAVSSLVLYSSPDGLAWKTVGPMEVDGKPNETTLRFEKDGKMLALVRREAGDQKGWVGRSAPPFTEWVWQPSNHRFGGQNLLQLDTGEWIVGTRDYSNMKIAGSWHGAAYLLARLMDDGRLEPLLKLPSGGDCSYPGLAQVGDEIWTTYYSSHEGKTSVFFAKIKIKRPSAQ
ncbi:MAG: hypothetical protein LBM92_05115 [Opitutaceae bacterium]|jgi:hypothetical protein|nr:hypothetical protein [Opitutaceae bacterium]